MNDKFYGEQLKIVATNRGGEYIRTVMNGKEEDNLPNLPSF